MHILTADQVDDIRQAIKTLRNVANFLEHYDESLWEESDLIRRKCNQIENVLDQAVSTNLQQPLQAAA